MNIPEVLAELRTEREKLDGAIRALENLDGAGRRGITHTTNGSGAIGSKHHGRRRISAAGRRRIAAAQKARWAKLKGKNAGATKSSSIGKAKSAVRHVSVAARRKMAAAQKARWAKIKAGKKSATPQKKAA